MLVVQLGDDKSSASCAAHEASLLQAKTLEMQFAVQFVLPPLLSMLLHELVHAHCPEEFAMVQAERVLGPQQGELDVVHDAGWDSIFH